jgi:hypothetical protein
VRLRDPAARAARRTVAAVVIAGNVPPGLVQPRRQRGITPDVFAQPVNKQNEPARVPDGPLSHVQRHFIARVQGVHRQ